MNDPYVLPEVCIALGMLGVVWHCGFERQRRDAFRCTIRRIRDDLFDFMWQHGFSYEDTAYRDARRQLNGMIYITGALSPVTIIAAGIVALRTHPPAAQPAKANDPVLQAEIVQARQRMAETIISFLFLESPLGWFCALLLLLVIAFRALNPVQRVKSIAQAGADYVVLNASALAATATR